MRDTQVISGEILLPSSDRSAESAEIVIQVEDVSRVDAPSTVIGEQRQRGISLVPGRALEFAVEIPASLVNDRHDYSVRAHIDMSGSGDVEVGDFVSTQSYPVLTRGHGTKVRIRVSRV